MVQFIKFALLFCSVASLSSFRLMSRAMTSRGGQVRKSFIKARESSKNGVLAPVNNNLLIKIKPVSTTTSSGLYIPDQSKDIPHEGVVIAAGQGSYHPESGVLMKMSAGVGDFVVYGKYDGTELKFNNEPHQIIKDDDVLLKYRNGEKSIANVECARGYVLIQLPPKESISESGLVMTLSGPGEGTQGSLNGIVVKVGAGRQTQSGSELPVEVCPGDSVQFSDDEGNSRLKIEGVEYVVVSAHSILAKWQK